MNLPPLVRPARRPGCQREETHPNDLFPSQPRTGPFSFQRADCSERGAFFVYRQKKPRPLIWGERGKGAGSWGLRRGKRGKRSLGAGVDADL